MVEIGGVELTDIEAKEMKRILTEERTKHNDEEIVEHMGAALISDEDPKDWAREIIRDLDEKVA
jgi:hypothetical protein